MTFKFPERVSLATLPTPIVRLERLSKAWAADVWIKRDDLTGAALSGNKIRKLEFELAEAVARKAKAVITCGALQSNHARATAIAARQLGLEPHLLLRTPDGKAPAEWDGNALLDRLVGAEIRYVTPDQYRNERAAIMAEMAEKLRAANKPAFVIPEGASDARGALGYVQAMREIVEQSREMGVSFAYVAHACGSGGTSAGLAMGNAIYDAGIFPVAFAVCDDESYFKNVVGGIVSDFAKTFGGISDPSQAKLSIIDRHKGIGYGQSTAEELAFIREVATMEGILLDPVYSGKAMFGVRQELQSGKTFRRGAPILFLHTGGMFGLFPKRFEFAF